MRKVYGGYAQISKLAASITASLVLSSSPAMLAPP